MVGELIFDWARKTPEKAAIIYNGQPLSYGSFAQKIGVARAYLAGRGYGGPGYAVLAFDNLLDFWILSLALRSLGLTTAAVGSAKMLAALTLPDVRCVIARPSEPWPDLAPMCAARGWPLLSVSLDDEPPTEGVPEHSHETGGHILLTSGTTGAYKMVLMSRDVEAFFLRRKVDAFRLTENSAASVFGYKPWTGTATGVRRLSGRWAAPFSSSKDPNLSKHFHTPGSRTRSSLLHCSATSWRLLRAPSRETRRCNSLSAAGR